MLTCFVVLSISTLAISQIERKTKDELYTQIELFSYALTTIQSEYVDIKEPQELIYGSLKGMLGSLDPHSQFLDPEEYKDLKTETQGKFGGLGIEISIRDGLLTIITPIEGTPAWKVGLKAKDRIVKIEDELTKDMTLNEAVKKLRGKPGSEVNLTILREKDFKLHTFKIVREIIKIQDVKDPQILEENIGYVRLAEFREETAKEFKKELHNLKSQGADSLILDLRNNPGGLLNVAIKVTELFLPNGQIVVSTKGRRSSQNIVTRSTNTSDDFRDWPVVILINEGSASGSEILAGALKDNKRAIILGTQSFGKGSVQSVIPLPDGSGLRLTTSKYFTPSGTSIHGTGITPDIIVEFKERDEEAVPKEAKEIKEQQDHVEKIFEDIELENVEDPETIKKKNEEQERRKLLLEDNQVQSAMSVIQGIKVYRKMQAQADQPETNLEIETETPPEESQDQS